MENDFSEPSGKFPHQYTHTERFQIRSSVQPLADDVEMYIRFCDTRLPALAAARDWAGFPKRMGPSPTADREDNQRRSVKRAQKRCRHHIVMARCDRMFTYTVRLSSGQSPLTREEMLRAWAYYIKSAKQGDSGFRFVCAMELQKNGQPHIHAAIKGFKNLSQHHRLWCDALSHAMGKPKGLYHGEDALGNIDGGVNRHLKKKRSMKDKASKMAAYMSKYMTKDADYVPFNGKRYFHTIGIEIPAALAKWMEEQDMTAAVHKLLDAHGLVLEDGTISPGVYCKWDNYCAFIVVPHSAFPPPPF